MHRGPGPLTADGEVRRLRQCCSSDDTANWIPLAVEGATLRAALIESCGKRGTLVLDTIEYPNLVLSLEHHVAFEGLDGVQQKLIALDDSSAGLILYPAASTSVKVARARVNFWLTNEDPATHLAPPTAGQLWEPRAYFNVQLAFATN